jgi:hypothetical protein
VPGNAFRAAVLPAVSGPVPMDKYKGRGKDAQWIEGNCETLRKYFSDILILLTNNKGYFKNYLDIIDRIEEGE